MSYSNKQARLNDFLDLMKAGKLYRPEPLSEYSNNLSRDLADLVKESRLKKAGPGLYYKPKKLGNFDVPLDKSSLVKEFLKTKSGSFLIRHLSDFHGLRLGTTQHSKKVFVYNKKRNGDFTLDGTEFAFRKRKFPKVESQEYLLVDMLNNLKELGEDSLKLLMNLERRLPSMGLDMNKLLETSEKYGKTWVKRFLNKLDRKYALST